MNEEKNTPAEPQTQTPASAEPKAPPAEAEGQEALAEQLNELALRNDASPAAAGASSLPPDADADGDADVAGDDTEADPG